MKKKNKKHCMVVHAYYPIGEPRVQREAEALIENGYEVDVICLRQPGEPYRSVKSNGVNVYRLPVHRHKGKGLFVQFLEYLLFFFLATWRLATLHYKNGYSIIQIHNPPDFLVFVTLIPRLLGTKVILDLHDLMPEFYSSRFKNNRSSWLVRMILLQERIACGFADHIITVTEPWRQTLIQRGVSPDKCSVVMNLADSRYFQVARKINSLSQNHPFHLFYHGNLTKRYGVDYILQAVAKLKNEIPDLALIIHGRGEFLKELEGLAQKLGLENDVQFNTEYLPIEDLPALIAQADLGIVPYRRDVFTDGILPTKLMEYAALGVPAVVARTPATTAYFDETMVEFFTPENVEELAQRIQTLYHNRPRLQELASNIQKFNQKYNWAVHKTEYVNLVKRLGLGKPRKNPSI